MLQPYTAELKIDRIPIVAYMREFASPERNIDSEEILSNPGATILQHALKQYFNDAKSFKYKVDFKLCSFILTKIFEKIRIMTIIQ